MARELKKQKQVPLVCGDTDDTTQSWEDDDEEEAFCNYYKKDLKSNALIGANTKNKKHSNAEPTPVNPKHYI
jgi:hypothetical protein